MKVGSQGMNSFLYYAKEPEFEMQGTSRSREDLYLLQVTGRVTKSSDLLFTKTSVIAIKRMNLGEAEAETENKKQL